MRRRTRRNKYNNRMGKLCITLMVLTLLGVMSVQIVGLYQKDQAYAAQEKDLTERLADETERQADLVEYEKYVHSQEYVEDAAKSKLGMVYDNEIVFKEEKE